MAAELKGNAAAEWRDHWTVVVAACAGVAISTINSYSTSLFIEPFEKEFGWTRAQISSGPAIASVAAVLLGPFIGHLVDRVGSRRLGLLALISICLANSMVSMVGPSIVSWRVIWMVLAIAIVLIQPTVWTSAVTGLFSKGRGLALAVTLCGSGIGSLVTPPLTYALIEHFGWRMAYIALAAFWGILVIPIVYLFFTSATDRARQAHSNRLAPQSLRQKVRSGIVSRRFVQIAIAGLCIAVVIVSIAVTIVPILEGNGVGRGTAAGIASLLGVASIAGRLTIGFLLDRLPGRYIAAICVCLPIFGLLLLLGNPGSVLAASAAVLIFGLSLGAELDILAYLTSRYFRLEDFGLMFGTLGGLITLAGGVGPMLMNGVYDATRSYTLALWCAIPLCVISSLLFLSLGPYPAQEKSDPEKCN